MSEDKLLLQEVLGLFQIIAHELGHILGLSHDFTKPKMKQRFNSKGGNCTKIGGIMDYEGNKNKWSNCSNEDFQKTYHGCLVAKK